MTEYNEKKERERKIGRRGTLLLGCLQLQRQIGSDFQPKPNCPQAGGMERKKEEGVSVGEGCGYKSRLDIGWSLYEVWRSRNGCLCLVSG
jgi:hypothetical protein